MNFEPEIEALRQRWPAVHWSRLPWGGDYAPQIIGRVCGDLVMDVWFSKSSGGWRVYLPDSHTGARMHKAFKAPVEAIEAWAAAHPARVFFGGGP